ncbi:keratin, type I cuticular Ha1-like [Alligator mississippiensis]|uniref:keratin, type I cuticular Ha1-like n=1 Tax=Alligator mississippiensis TaxID=8496 RepID=UPI002877F4F4|nr:keratin, type I cuticular Ha1-like [Alligator mississippiensis]
MGIDWFLITNTGKNVMSVPGLKVHGPQEICCAKADNARLCLDVDNLKVASDDYATKYEYEHGLCQSAEADIKSLRRILDDLTLCKADLETELESLTEELLCLRKNHEEEASPLRRQLGDRINVELDAAPSCDLNKVLEEIRYQYETLVDKNQCEVEDWYHTQMEELNKEVISSGEQLQGYQNEIIQLKHTVQALEIDLQTQHNLNTALENTLAETETHYSQQLSELQCLVSDVEVQLAELRSDIDHQDGEYKVLLDAKCQLDCEISVYHSLLDVEDCRLPNYPGNPGCAPSISSAGGKPVWSEPIQSPVFPSDCTPSIPAAEPNLIQPCCNPCAPTSPLTPGCALVTQISTQIC